MSTIEDEMMVAADEQRLRAMYLAGYKHGTVFFAASIQKLVGEPTTYPWDEVDELRAKRSSQTHLSKQRGERNGT